MSTIRINKTKDYTVMSNYHFKEKNMSLKAKGLLSQMLSLPDNWNYSINGLVAINKENETSIKNILKELQEFNYLKITKLMPNQTTTGRIEYVYDIYERPLTKQEVQKQGLENLGVEFLEVEFLEVENPPQLNTNEESIEELNTKELKEKEIYKEKTETDFINEVIVYMNTCGLREDFEIKKEFKFNSKASSNIKIIKARLNEGYTLDDFKDVIFNAYDKLIENEFKGYNGKSSIQYYNPSTIFTSSKMEQYKNEYDNV